jgi:isopentenyl-diphosphate delta-isomerase
MSELISLVDESDNIVGQMEKYACHRRTATKNYGHLHRAFSLFIFDPVAAEQMLIQKRSEVKYTFPSRWSNAVCSHPNHPNEVNGVEGIKKAAIRRAKQELGIDINAAQLTVVGRILYEAVSNEEYAEWELDYLVFCRHPVSPDNINPQEVERVSWINIKELDKVTNPTPWFQKLTQSGILYQLWTRYESEQSQFDLTIKRL